MKTYIEEINIIKLRHLENIHIDISSNRSKNHLILTGKNGAGKTTVLKSIKKYLKSIEDNMYYPINIDYKKSIEYYKNRINEIDQGLNINKENPFEKQQLQDNMKSLQDTINSYENGLNIGISNDFEVGSKYKNGEFILAYFDANRDSKVIVPNSVNRIELQNNYSIDADIDTKFLDYLVYLKTQQSFARNENDLNTVNSIGAWFDNLEEALKNLFEDTSIKLKFDYRNLDFKIQQDGREDYGLNELSDGFSAVLDIVMNLILRMEKDREGLSYDKEGIVLIDELETHLHIGLQKKILPFLVSFFPNIQFIVTTHSPFVISSIDNAVIFDLEKKIKLEDLSAYSYDGIVEGYFNIDKYSTEAKEKLFRYKELVNKIDKNEEEESEEFELRNYLKGIPETLASEIVYEFKNIELSKLKKR
ncbi:AAA family ATPase [Clostridium sp. UBA1652]|uniref:AAA family ATPase n=1 Tax=Clostridium sp. UBA1652 TaxID=1946348 RepID=UPI00257C808A|nr:AAA family ATPase [Clostridium sp. UBA1652]